MVKLRDCKRCSGATVRDYDGRICVQCGKTDYTHDPRVDEYRRHKNKKKGSLNILDEMFVSKANGGRGNSIVKVFVISRIKKQGAEYIGYDMECPYPVCREVTEGKPVPNSMEMRYSCLKGHVWYLFVRDGQPVYWR